MAIFPAEYLASCEERFGKLANNLGYCDVCPCRENFLTFMAEEDPVNVPEGYVTEAALARSGCARARQIQNGETPTAEVNPLDCFAVLPPY